MKNISEDPYIQFSNLKKRYTDERELHFLNNLEELFTEFSVTLTHSKKELEQRLRKNGEENEQSFLQYKKSYKHEVETLRDWLQEFIDENKPNQIILNISISKSLK